MKDLATSALSGLTFGVGLCLAGMTQPSKVVGFLDVFGAWDLSLALVMVGAIGVYGVATRVLTPRVTADDPGCAVDVPLDRRLLLGSAIFGVGWALAGYCPGPAVVSVAGLAAGPVVFVGAMLGGMKLQSWLAPQSE